MSKNLIPKIAEMLGVELGEEFKVKGAKGADGTIFWFDLDGLHAETCEMADVTLWQLVLGNETIVKLPWKPGKGEVFWTFNCFFHGSKWEITSFIWRNEVFDNAVFKAGWAFRTRAEAEAALPAVAEKVGVEYEL